MGVVGESREDSIQKSKKELAKRRTEQEGIISGGGNSMYKGPESGMRGLCWRSRGKEFGFYSK